MSSRPICDYTGLPCGSVWYIRVPTSDELPLEDPDRKEFNSPQAVVLSQEAYESGKIPKCFDPATFKKETLTEKLEKANKGSMLCLHRKEMDSRRNRTTFKICK